MSTIVQEKAADFAAAKRLARKVLEDNFIGKPPVMASSLTEAYGLETVIAVFKTDYEHIAGFIDFDKHKIVVNADDRPPRRNFTIAHELGHYLLGHREESGYTVLLRNTDEMVKTPFEQEANCFAAHLLVPTPFLQEYLDMRLPITNYDLAQIFGVSVEVIRNRRINVK